MLQIILLQILGGYVIAIVWKASELPFLWAVVAALAWGFVVQILLGESK